MSLQAALLTRMNRHRFRGASCMASQPPLVAIVWFLLILAGVSGYLLAPSVLGEEAVTPVKVTSVEGITEYRLPNGLQILLFPDPSQTTVTVNITYRVGSRHEGRGEAGMAHLLEHMVFKGTPTFANIWGALEDHGASFNGTTWVDRTNYFETLPSTDENLAFALRMEADRMVNSFISDEALAKEMTVVRNEFEMGENNPTGVLSERMMSTAYLWHNYGKSTIGNRSDIERVPGEYLRRFYRLYYQPDNATLLVAGRFDEARVLELIGQYFGSIPRPDRVLDATYTEEPPQDGPRMVTLKRVGDVAAAGLIYHIPAGSSEEFPALELLVSVLTDQPSGHLYRRLVVPGIATGVSGSAFSWAEPGVLELGAQVAHGKDPKEVLEYMIDTVERIAPGSITDAEVQRARTRALKDIKLAMTNSAGIGIMLSEFIAQGDWRLFFLQRDRLQAVTTSEVQQAAARYLVESNRTAGLFIPTEEPVRVAVSKTPDVQELTRDYQSRQQIAQGEALAPEVAEIEKRITRKSLPSGIRLAFLPMQTRGDAAYLACTLHVGTEADLTGKTTAANLIPSLLMRGTKQHNFQQLRDAIDKLQSSIDVGGGGGGRRGGGGMGGDRLGSVSASITSDHDHIVPAIQLLGEILQQPAFDPAEFDIVVKRQRSFMEMGMSDPSALGMIAMSRALNPWPESNIHYVPTLPERLQRLDTVTLKDVQRIYQQLYGASRMDICVVGDFSVPEVTQAIESTFGNWKSATPYQRIAEPLRPIKADSIVIQTPDKEMAIVGMATTFAMRDDDPDYPAMVLASYVFGQSAKSRLINRLRHEGGLSYGAFAAFSADDRDRRASLLGSAICAPQNAKPALEGMQEEWQRWVARGIDDDELLEAKKGYSSRFERTLTNPQFLVGEILSGLDNDRTLQFRADLMQHIESLTADQIQESLKRQLGAVPIVEMMAGDVEPQAAKTARRPGPTE